jgi:hypothetical protein
LGEITVINEEVRKWTRKGARAEKQGKADVGKPGKSKKGKKMRINKENGWIVDQP